VSGIVFLGATKGIGRALARRLAGRGDRLVLLGRDVGELARSGADLDARSPSGQAVAATLACDLLEPDGFAAALAGAWSALGRVDAVVVTAGLFATQAALESDRALTRRLLETDFSGTVLFCEEARERLLGQGGGTLCVLGSVAGERGRKPVILYGAAKAGLSRYLEGLDHKFRAHGLRVVCVKPGFVRTSMTDGLPEPPFAGDPDDVARTIERAIDRGTPVVFAPAPWRWVMLVIRLLPRFVMRRVGF
jgi:NAD(P)-dependent dehydrogenase (short-subunit alcohol dehydrogenase family)